MNTLNSIYHKIQEKIYLKEQAEKAIVANETERSEKINTVKKHYEQFSASLCDDLSKLKPGLESICYLVSPRLFLCESGIKYDGNDVEPYKAEQDPVTLYRGLIGDIKRIMMAIIDGTEADLLALARSYTTLEKMYSEINRFMESAVDKINAEHLKKAKELKDKAAGLSVQIDELNDLVSIAEITHLPLSIIQAEPKTIHASNPKIPLGVSYIYEEYRVLAENMTVSAVFEWDLTDYGILYIQSDSAEQFEKPCFFDVVSGTIIRCILSYPVQAVRLVFFNALSDERVISFGGALGGVVSSLFLSNRVVKCETTEQETASAVGELNALINHRLTLIGQSGYGNILEYNEKNPDNAQPLVFSLLHGYPNGFSQSSSAMSSALKNGRKAGVYFIVTAIGDGVSDKNDWATRQLPSIKDFDDCITARFRDGGLEIDGELYSAEINKIADEMPTVITRIKSQFSSASAAIVFSSLLPSEDFITSTRRSRYSSVLSLPIGKVGAKPLVLDLNSEGDAHVIVSGAPGSGKSSLLNAIILSAAMLYSPDEVEIHIISMIKSEFGVYERNGLPHLKMIVTGDDIVGATDVLGYLSDTMQQRQNIIGSVGDIAAYNRSVPNEKRLPRTVIVIDEYHKLIMDERGNINDAALGKIISIAKTGRSCGMCLILSSQSVVNLISREIDLFRHRFEFKGAELIPEAANRKRELEGVPGLCFYGNGAALVLARIAFPGKTGDGMFIDTVADIKSRFPSEMVLKSRVERISVDDPQSIPFLSSRAQYDYDEEGSCRIRLGKKYLSCVPLEYSLNNKNKLLCIFGDYLTSKNIEAAVIKDALYLSRNYDRPSVYYIELNKNPIWARKKQAVKTHRDEWMLGGRFAYYAANALDAALDDISALIDERESNADNEDCPLNPVIVIISCAESVPDSSALDTLSDLLSNGKNSNVFFVLQFNEYGYGVPLYSVLHAVEDAILLPDPKIDGEAYSSTALVEFLSHTQAVDSVHGLTEVKDMLNNLLRTPLNPELNILCNNNQITCFMPYVYTDGFFDKLDK